MFLFHIYSWSVLDGYRIAWQLLSQHISGIIPLSLASVWLSISQLSASLLWATADSVLCWQNPFWRLKGFHPQMLRMLPPADNPWLSTKFMSHFWKLAISEYFSGPQIRWQERLSALSEGQSRKWPGCEGSCHLGHLTQQNLISD